MDMFLPLLLLTAIAPACSFVSSLSSEGISCFSLPFSALSPAASIVFLESLVRCLD